MDCDPVVTWPTEGLEETNIDFQGDIHELRPRVSVALSAGHVVNGVLHVNFLLALRASDTVSNAVIEEHFSSFRVKSGEIPRFLIARSA